MVLLGSAQVLLHKILSLLSILFPPPKGPAIRVMWLIWSEGMEPRQAWDPPCSTFVALCRLRTSPYLPGGWWLKEAADPLWSWEKPLGLVTAPLSTQMRKGVTMKKRKMSQRNFLSFSKTFLKSWDKFVPLINKIFVRSFSLHSRFDRPALLCQGTTACTIK